MSRVVVIGGGIAGVAVLRALAKRRREVVLFEREPQLGAGSSGKSAAIFRLAVGERINVELALRSRVIGAELVDGGTVRATGGLYLCDDEDERARILDASASAGVRVANASERPSPLANRDRPALFSPDDGVIDTHALVHALWRDAKSNGALLQLGSAVDELVFTAGRVTGVRVANREVDAEVVVDATGAWSPTFAPGDVGIRPHRRHLFVIDSPHAREFDGVVWDLSANIYLRPESGGLLVSPCDEEAMAATDHVPTTPDAAALLFEKLRAWAPSLADARVRSMWAGLRPLTRDHRFVVGFDPRFAGLFRLGGFGGHGMTAGAAAGELAAAIIEGDDPPQARELDPARPFT